MKFLPFQFPQIRSLVLNPFHSPSSLGTPRRPFSIVGGKTDLHAGAVVFHQVPARERERRLLALGRVRDPLVLQRLRRRQPLLRVRRQQIADQVLRAARSNQSQSVFLEESTRSRSVIDAAASTTPPSYSNLLLSYDVNTEAVSGIFPVHALEWLAASEENKADRLMLAEEVWGVLVGDGVPDRVIEREGALADLCKQRRLALIVEGRVAAQQDEKHHARTP